MAKKAVTLGVSVAAMCVLFGGYALLKNQNEKAEQAAQEETEGESITDLSVDEVASVSFAIDGESRTFLQEDGEWTLEGDETFPVDSTQMESLLARFAPLSAVRTLADVEDVSEYGMEEPANQITLTDTDGGETILTIGANNGDTGDDYLMKDEDETVIYTVASSLREALPTDLYDFAVSEELPSFSAENITTIIVNRSDGNGYTLKRDEEDSDTWVLDDGEEELDQDDIEMAVSNLGYLSYDGYVDHNCTEDETYGFGETELTIIYQEYVKTEEDTEAESDSEEEDAGTDTASADSGTSDAGTAEETESETTASSSSDNLVSHQITFKVGDTDADGNYYVQQKDSTEVHVFSSAMLDTFLQLGL